MPVKSARKGKSKPRSQKKTKGFFHSTIARLFLVLLIAAAIPLTVMRVQQMQDIRQLAAGETCENIKMACSGEVVADQLCHKKGEKIVFSKEDGTSFNMERYGFGNGAKNCTETGTTVTCDAVGTGGKTKPVTHHTVTRDQIDVCKYGVEWVESTDPKPTSRLNPTTGVKVTPTARPTKESAGCEGNLTSAACTADKKPRLSLTWNMKGGTTCSVKVNGVEVSKECSSSNTVITDLSGKVLESSKEYTLVISNGTTACKDKEKDKETTAKCSTTNNEGSPQEPGTQTTLKLSPPEAVKAKCDASGTQADPKIKVYGYTAPLATSYIVRLRNSVNGTVVKEEKTDKTELILPIEIDKNYYYSAIAIDKDGKKTVETKRDSNRRIKCTNANFPLAGAPTALDIISDIWDEITH